MELWEMMCGNVNDFSVLVFANDEDAWSGIFKPDGKPKVWSSRPTVRPFVDKRRKKQKPQADIGFLTPGTFFLNNKAKAALADLLSPFGELLEVDCEGETKYYYNVINLVSCIDYDKSVKIGTAVTRAVFRPDAIPHGMQIFKDPLTVSTAIYLTADAKALLEQQIAAAKLTGLRIFEAGTR